MGVPAVEAGWSPSLAVMAQGSAGLGGLEGQASGMKSLGQKSPREVGWANSHFVLVNTGPGREK